MANDEHAPLWLARLLDEHGAALVLYARQWCSTPEDVVQQALLELVTQRERPDNVLGWLYRVVRNSAISAARGQSRAHSVKQGRPCPRRGFRIVAAQLDVEEATAALASLPLELREVVVARIWGNLKYSEIAGLVGTSLSTAQRRYEQGIRELQNRLEQPCTTNQQPPTRD